MTRASWAQTYEVLVNFDVFNGQGPTTTALIQGPDGNFYGTTPSGGAKVNGTVFAVTPSGSLRFLSLSNGARAPEAGLLLGGNGDFYGTTVAGGQDPKRNFGTVFKLRTGGRFTRLHSFSDGTDGAEPRAPLIQAVNGKFYGTTSAGGLSSVGGTVYTMNPNGVLSTVHEFCMLNNCADGGAPYAGLVQAADGVFYGTTSQGGDTTCTFNESYGCGTVFSVTPAGKFKTLHVFEGFDGAVPVGGLIQATDGNFYGTTSYGGPNGYANGTVFQIKPDGTFTTIYNFCSLPNCTDGAGPIAGLIEATNGNLYGTASVGGDFGAGTIFEISPQGEVTTLHSFCSQPSCTDGEIPSGNLLQATTGKFYGMTQLGGTSVYGTVYSFDIGLGPFVSLVRATGHVGQAEGILGQGFIGATGVSFNGTAASFTVKADTFLTATVPTGATSGYVTVTTPTGTLTSNKPFIVVP